MEVMPIGKSVITGATMKCKDCEGKGWSPFVSTDWRIIKEWCETCQGTGFTIQSCKD